MLLTSLAARADISPALLDALVCKALRPETLGRQEAGLPAALAGNEHVSLRVAGKLLAVHPDLAPNIFGRADVDAGRAIDLLDGTRTVSTLRAAMREVHDPEGRLAGHVYGVRPDSFFVCLDVMGSPGAPLDVRVRAALTLAASPPVVNGDLDKLSRFVREVCLRDDRQGRALIAELRTRSTSKALHQRLTKHEAWLRNPPVAGSHDWFNDVGTTPAEVVQWAHGVGGAPAWNRAVRDFTDPTGQVAEAALDACPGGRWICERVVRTTDLPAPVRTRAARALLDAGFTEWLPLAESAELLTCADLGFVEWFLSTGLGAGTHVAAIAGRGDLTAELVGATDAARQRCLNTALPAVGVPGVPAAPRPALVWVHREWDTWLALHTHCPAQLRSEALYRLRSGRQSGLLGVLEATSTAELSSATEVARVGLLAPVGSLTRAEASIWSTSGGRALLTAALGRFASCVTRPDQVKVLLSLVSGAAFAGTLADLLLVVQSITTP